MFHGHNERVDTESLKLSTMMWEALAREFLGGVGLDIPGVARGGAKLAHEVALEGVDAVGDHGSPARRPRAGVMQSGGARRSTVPRA